GRCRAIHCADRKTKGRPRAPFHFSAVGRLGSSFFLRRCFFGFSLRLGGGLGFGWRLFLCRGLLLSRCLLLRLYLDLDFLGALLQVFLVLGDHVGQAVGALGSGLEHLDLGLQPHLAGLVGVDLFAGIVNCLTGAVNLLLQRGIGLGAILFLQGLELGEIVLLALDFLVDTLAGRFKLLFQRFDLFFPFIIETLSQFTDLRLQFVNPVLHLFCGHGLLPLPWVAESFAVTIVQLGVTENRTTVYPVIWSDKTLQRDIHAGYL